MVFEYDEMVVLTMLDVQLHVFHMDHILHTYLVEFFHLHLLCAQLKDDKSSYFCIKMDIEMKMVNKKIK